LMFSVHKSSEPLSIVDYWLMSKWSKLKETDFEL